LTDTEATILAENGGDMECAFRDACRLYEWAMSHMSAGLVRADTSRLKWQPKPPPSAATSDDWIGTIEKPE